MEDYRKKMFRGAKIEDCIMEFQNRHQRAREQMNEAAEPGEKRFFEGIALAYQMAAQKLRWEFDYKKEEWEQEITQKIETVIREIERCEEAARTAQSAPLAEIPAEIPPEARKGVFEGMALAYRLIVQKLRWELEQRAGKESMGQIAAYCISEFERIASETEAHHRQTSDAFAEGFANGMVAAYRSAVLQLKLQA